jgi:UDP-GlcNAc:undecaprenyl-phosphate GlcNAc-1-phosphate transferase
VLILCLWTALASAAALIPTYTNRGNSLVPIALAALALILFTILHPRLRRRDEEERELVDGDAMEVVDLADRRRLRDGTG